MNHDKYDSPSDDTDEWIRRLSSDDGRIAQAHLAAGRPIYYREIDTPTGICIKEFPDGHREWVTFDLNTGKEVLVRVLNASEDPDLSLADAVAQHGEDADFEFEAPRMEFDRLRGDEDFSMDRAEETSSNELLTGTNPSADEKRGPQ